jgi:4'-phosphopantetheinyl transferase
MATSKEHEMQELSDAFSRVVTSLRDSAVESGCTIAWALNYAQCGEARVEILGSPALARLPDTDEILVWLGAVDADVDAVKGAAAPLLIPEEHAAAMLLHNPADRCAALASHAGLRLMLGAAAGIPPLSVRIHRGAHGKPLIDAGDLHFSLSHVRGAVALAVAQRPVGIDIERRTALPDIDAIAATVLAPESRMALDALKGAERIDMFYRFWTLGEAFIKATGLGLSQGLDSFAFTAVGEPRLTRVDPKWGPAERWRFGFC